MPFRDCIGHRRLLAVLARAVARASLPPSLMLAGPTGIGKSRVALALAQALNCPTPTSTDTLEVDACGTCTSCQRIARRTHPDVLLIEPGSSGSIKVDQVRDAVDRAAYRPFEGKRRVVVIDDADALVDQAQNALLKTLEEPPAASVFLLVTSRPDAMLATIRSRCPQLRFGPLSDDEVVQALRRANFSETEARAVATTADGSIGRALAATAGDLVESRDIAARVLRHAATAGDARRRLEGTKELLSTTGHGGAEDREQVSLHLRAMASLLRDVELLATGADATGLANADVRDELDRLQAYHGDRGLRAFAAVDRALAALDRNASPKVVADWLLLQL